jgi:hypothetical protein
MLGTVISCNTCTWNNVLFECWLRRGDNVEHLTKETIVLPVICPWSRNRRTLFFLQKTKTTIGKSRWAKSPMTEDRNQKITVGKKPGDRRSKPKRPRPNSKSPGPKWPIKYWVENFIDRIKFDQFGHFILSNRTDQILRQTVPIFRFCDVGEMWNCWMLINFYSIVHFYLDCWTFIRANW